MRKFLILSSLSAFILSGCYEYQYTKSPYPVKHKASDQFEIQSAYHWKLMAKDFANSLEKINGKIYLLPIKNNNSIFAKNFLNLLKSELIKRKKLVLNDTKDATKIEVKIDIVRFNSNRNNLKYPYKFTTLALGLWVLTPVTSPVVGAALATGGVIGYESAKYQEISKYYPNVPKYEIIINAYAYKNNNYVSAVDKIYYIADKDKNLYDDSPIIRIRGNYE